MAEPIADGALIVLGLAILVGAAVAAMKGMRSIIARKRGESPALVSSAGATCTGTDFGPTEAQAWLAAMESGKLAVPRDVHDSEDWDRYWRAQIEFGGIEQGFGDMMANDPRLIPGLARRGARSILCVGNGLSSESWALALHGFDVTVLDVSSIPRAFFTAIRVDADHPLHRVPGFTACGEDRVMFIGTEPINPEHCPPMHKTDLHPPVGGGSLTSVTGDLLNSDLCAGPFDVVIERRTIQLFTPEERSAALDRLADRLSANGILISHQHSGGWRPGQPRTHYATQWSEARGFLCQPSAMDDASARVARLIFTTG